MRTAEVPGGILRIHSLAMSHAGFYPNRGNRFALMKNYDTETTTGEEV